MPRSHTQVNDVKVDGVTHTTFESNFILNCMIISLENIFVCNKNPIHFIKKKILFRTLLFYVELIWTSGVSFIRDKKIGYWSLDGKFKVITLYNA